VPGGLALAAGGGRGWFAAGVRLPWLTLTIVPARRAVAMRALALRPLGLAWCCRVRGLALAAFAAGQAGVGQAAGLRPQ
jgi:hypothetical protein